MATNSYPQWLLSTDQGRRREGLTAMPMRTSPGWLRNRLDGPSLLRASASPLTDVELISGDVSVLAHRLLLSVHSTYFASLFSSGMREAREGVVDVGASMGPETLVAIVDYIYSGKIPDKLSFSSAADLLAAAHMLQMPDLEEIVRRHMIEASLNKPKRRLALFLFIRENEAFFCNDRDGVECANFAEATLVDTVKHQWHTIVDPANNLSDDDYVTSLTDLDLISLKRLLALKSAQEEVADFSFSFNQDDLALAVVQWIRADGENRIAHLEELRRFYCVHQVKTRTVQALQSLAIACSDGKETSEIGCVGIWCPQRTIQGLLLIHAWAPHKKNRITGDHIFYDFVVPTRMVSKISSKGQDDYQPLSLDRLYPMLPFGELGAGEKHLLLPNNCPRVSSALEDPKNRLMLTFDAGWLSGIALDPEGGSHACGPLHHSTLLRFCPSVAAECACGDLASPRMSVCDGDKQGRITVIVCPTCQDCREDDGTYDPRKVNCRCETFRVIKPPASSQSLFHAVGLSATSVKYGDTSDVVYHLGGYSLTPTMDSSGPFSYVSCNFSLQQYESGHSRVVTAVTHLLDVPIPNLRVQMSDMLPTSPHSSDRDYNWVDVAEMKLPSPVGDAAVVQKDNGEIWVLGGFKIDYDDKLHLFYQNPVTDVWIYSAEVRSWREGPPLPKNERSCGNKGYTRGTGCILDNGCILYSGGACLRLDNHPYANQIYEFVANTSVLVLSPDADDWEKVLDLSDFAGTREDGDYALVAAFPAQVTLPRLKARGGRFAARADLSDYHYSDRVLARSSDRDSIECPTS